MLSMTVPSSLLGDGLANRLIHAIAKRRGVFNTGAGVGANMQLELPCIALREKVLP